MLTFLKGKQDLPATEHRRAIVTLTVGDEFMNLWSMLARASWESYAKKFGYDIVVITDHLDTSERSLARSPSWQKLLVASQPWAQKYERMVWIDADIIISHSAPDIMLSVPDAAKAGMCPNIQLSMADWQIYEERMRNIQIPPTFLDTFYSEDLRVRYDRYGLESDQRVDYGAGVLVLTPALHAPILRDVYDKHENRGRLYEQLPLAHTLASAGLVQVMNSRFNWHVHPVMKLSIFYAHAGETSANDYIAFLRNELDKSYFLHFAGGLELMRMLSEWYKHEAINKVWVERPAA